VPSCLRGSSNWVFEVESRFLVNSKSEKIIGLLRQFESQNITFIEPDGSWPIVWDRAKGMSVWDADGKQYLDWTAAFGVAAAGHANPRVVRAGQRQMAKLLHAMGDVHPHALKAELARELSRLTFERWSRSTGRSLHGKTIFCNSGFEAVEAGLKTALLATGKSGLIAFRGGYHGLGYGALNATHRSHFRAPFRAQLGRFASFVEFPVREAQLAELEQSIARLFMQKSIGAVLVEPIQGRGGINIPPRQFLPLLRQLCNRFAAVLIVDEIYTGFGRTGKWFASEHSRTVPDLICLGKALTGGFPLSACIGRAELMDSAWPRSTGEAIHTSTYLGHPVGCAMALAQIREIREKNLIKRSAAMGVKLLNALCRLEVPHNLQLFPRGIGLMTGLELRSADGKPATGDAIQLIKNLLKGGFILLPEGEHSNVVSFTPPLTLSGSQLKRTMEQLAKSLDSTAQRPGNYES
jgi:4-aminobutyrate aminotransferase-like enzyme